MSRCILGCPSSTDIALHTFPNPNKEQKRFQRWVTAVGGLKEATIDDFYLKRKICDIHFSEECRNKNTLTEFAVPTLYLEGIDCLLPSNPAIQRSTMMQEEYLDHELLDDETTFYSAQDDKTDYDTVPVNAELPKLKNGDGGNKNVHEGFKCNVCQNEIIGFRYVCVECSDWDMCGGCEACGQHPHHLVLRVPSPRPYAEIQTVLECIRERLYDEPKIVENCEDNIIDQDDIEKDNMYAVESIAESDMEAEYLEISDDNVESSNHQETVMSPTKFYISPTKFNTSSPKFTKSGPRRSMKSQNKSSFTKDDTFAAKVQRTEMSNGKKDLNQRERLVRKVTEVLKIRLPSGINVDSLQQSLKKDLVVKINRLPKSDDEDIKVIKDKKRCKKKEIPVT